MGVDSVASDVVELIWLDLMASQLALVDCTVTALIGGTGFGHPKLNHFKRLLFML